MNLFLQVLANGLLLGGLYGLVAMGLALVFGVMRVINVAHGALMVLGALSTYVLYTSLGWPPYLALPLVVVVLFLIGVTIERLLLERITRADELTSLLLLFGLGVAISQSAAAATGARFFSVAYWTGSIRLGGLAISRPLLYAFLIAVAVTVVLFSFLHRSRYGTAIRATAMAPDLAAATGVDVRRVRLMTFGIGSALAGAAGTLLVTSQGMNALSGDAFLLIAFAACVLGGLGSMEGALVAGCVIGLVEVGTSILADTQSAQLAIYVIFILMLLAKPAGLFGVRRA